MPNRTSPPGERISRLEAKFDAYERYSHERWHDLANDLQPIVGLPVWELTLGNQRIAGSLAHIADDLAVARRRSVATEGRPERGQGTRKPHAPTREAIGNADKRDSSFVEHSLTYMHPPPFVKGRA